MRIALLEPYAVGSHRAWAEGLAAQSNHEVRLFTLPGQFWKWRMQGGAVTLAEHYLASGWRADILLATDMLDLTTFLALTRPHTAQTSTAIYFHENQLTFPPPPGTKRDLTFGFINYVSALVAQRTLWNSAYHLEAFLDEVPRLLKHYPDYTNLHTVEQIRQRAMVLPPGLDLQRFERFKPEAPRQGPATLLWNHRWEYDKQPQAFFEALDQLIDEGMEFRLILAGESFRKSPTEFLAARERYGGRVIHFGYAEHFADYARLLWQADIQVSTALHEFFGLATLEAIFCDCFPILPNRLAYPEYIPEGERPRILYDDQVALVERLRWAIANVHALREMSFRPLAAAYDWTVLGPHYDAVFEALGTQEPFEANM